MIITSPGLYKDITNEDYHASEGISNSGLRALLPPNCPKNYWYKYLSGEYVSADSRSTSIGSAVHTLVLEPEEFEKRYFCYPMVDRRTKEGKDAYQEALIAAAGKEVLTHDQMDQCQQMADAIRNHSVFRELVNLDSGNVEHSIAWIDEDSGALLRSRPDYYNDKVIVDIKTSRDITPSGFSRSAHQYGYHSQASMACDGLRALTGRNYSQVVIPVVSNEPPYLVKTYVLSGEALLRGRQEYKTGARIYQSCKDLDIWPGYEEALEELSLPSWVMNNDFTGE